MTRSLITFCFFFLVVLIIPTLIVIPFAKGDDAASKDSPNIKTSKKAQISDPNITVSVFRSTKDRVDKVPFEDYLVGVVASEMPADFNMEALKAQSLAARTYIVQQLLYQSGQGNPPSGADVTDTPSNQVYQDKTDLKKDWGAKYKTNLKRIEDAVKETNNEILTYNGEPITASFFSTSNGYTENAEEYWSNPYPYLKSVKSPWDQTESPKFLHKVEMDVNTFESKLGVPLPEGNGTVGTVLKRTTGHRVAQFKIGGKTFTGRQIREKLELKSSDFTMVRQGNNITITTIGYGHGVGMSQYGANALAKQGKSYKDIVKYYYSGIDITGMATYTAKLASKK